MEGFVAIVAVAGAVAVVAVVHLQRQECCLIEAARPALLLNKKECVW